MRETPGELRHYFNRTDAQTFRELEFFKVWREKNKFYFLVLSYGLNLWNNMRKL